MRPVREAVSDKWIVSPTSLQVTFQSTQIQYTCRVSVLGIVILVLGRCLPKTLRPHHPGCLNPKALVCEVFQGS